MGSHSRRNRRNNRSNFNDRDDFAFERRVHPCQAGYNYNNRLWQLCDIGRNTGYSGSGKFGGNHPYNFFSNSNWSDNKDYYNTNTYDYTGYWSSQSYE